MLRRALDVLGPRLIQFGSDRFFPCSGRHLRVLIDEVLRLLDELEVSGRIVNKSWRARRRSGSVFPVELDPVPSEGRIMSNGVSSSNGVPSRTGNIRPLQVLQIIGNAIVGGMETYVSNLLRSCRATNFKLRVCVLTKARLPRRCAGSGSKFISRLSRMIRPGAQSRWRSS